MLPLLVLAALTKIPKFEWFTKNINLCFTVLTVGKSKTKGPADSASGEDLISGSQMVIFLLQPHMVEVARELSEACFIRTRIQSGGFHLHNYVHAC